MCTSPLSLRIRSDYDPVLHHVRDYVGYDGVKSSCACSTKSPCYITRTFPCGHCAECLKTKHSKLSYRLYRECCRSSSVHFITFTYRNDTIPISCVHEFYDSSVDSRSGELALSEPYFPSDSIQSLYRKYLLLHSPGNNVMPDLLHYSSPHSGSFFIAPSIDRRGFRLFIKRCRVNYERWNNHPLDFKYMVVGEYGSKTRRPHFHMLAFGLTRNQVGFISSQWHQQFGNCDVRFVTPDFKDGCAEGYAKVSRYLSKYCSKGLFDKDRPSYAFSEHSRIMSSKGIGFAPKFESSNEGYPCIPVVPKFANSEDKSLFDFLLLHDKGLTPFDWFSGSKGSEELFAVIRSRQKLLFQQYYCKCPDAIIKQVYYYYDKSKKSYQRKPLYVSYENWLARVVYQELRDKLPLAYSIHSEGSNLSVLRFEHASSLALQAREKSAFESLRKSYARCHF